MERNEKTTSRPQSGKRAVIYLRTAIPNKKEIARQEEACLELLDQHNSSIIAIIKEDGISGNADIEARPGLSQAVEMCETGMTVVLICYSLDRLSRDPNVLMSLLDRLEQAEIGLETVTEGDIFANPSHFEVYISILHIERRRNSQRASQGRKTRNRQSKEEQPLAQENLRLFDE